MKPCRIAIPERVRGNVLRDDTSCPDHGVLTDGDAAEDRCIGSDAYPSFKGSLQKFRWIVLGPWIHVVGEGDIRSDEYVVADSEPIPQLHAAFDGDIVPEDHIVLDEAM